MARDLTKSEVYDVGRFGEIRRRQTTNADGINVVQKVPKAPYRTILNNEGDVVRVAVTSHPSIRNPGATQFVSSLAQKEAKWAQTGMLPYGKCPLTDGRFFAQVPGHLRADAPCTHGVNEDNPCKHVLEIQKIRKEANKAEQAKQAERRKSTQDKLLDVQLQEFELLKKNLLAEEAKKSKRGSKKDD